MRLALASYQPIWHPDLDAVAARLRDWVAEAAGAGAELLVFPEYAGIEAALLDGAPAQSAADWARAMAAQSAHWADLHADLARDFGVHILAGSLVAEDARGGLVNRAFLCSPTGVAHQDKIIPTPYERGEMGIASGDALRLFETALGRIGVLICYDSEFPLLARQLVSAGAGLILVPSCTDLPAGQTRVRQSARARAIEGQCIVAQAPLIGAVPGCDVVDISTGRAGVFVPPDHGFPASGILAEGVVDQPGWTFAEIDLAALSDSRATAQVGNRAHWPEQDRITTVAVTPL